MTKRYRVECLNPNCKWVGYRSPHSLNECACYDENSWYCTPITPGPGCPNGGNLRASCPHCHSDWVPDVKNFFGFSYFFVREVRRCNGRKRSL